VRGKERSDRGIPPLRPQTARAPGRDDSVGDAANGTAKWIRPRRWSCATIPPLRGPTRQNAAQKKKSGRSGRDDRIRRRAKMRGERRGLLVRFEGEREIEDEVADGNTQREFAGVSVAGKPNDSRSFLLGRE